MKKSTKKAVRIFRRTMFIGFLCIAVFCSGAILKKCDENMRRWDGLYHLEDNSIDVLFMGSSHSYCTFIPDVFDEAWGVNSYNLATSSQNVIQTYYNLKEILSRQHPRVVVFEAYSLNDVDNWQPDDDWHPSKILNLDGMRMGPVKREAVRAQMYPYNIALYYFTFYRVHSNWEDNRNVLTQAKKYLKASVDGTSVDETYKGYSGSTSEMTLETRRRYKKMKDVKGEYVICENQRKHFRMMAQLCRDQGIQLVVVMAPILKEWRLHTDYGSRHRQIKEMADEYGAPFLDYNVLYEQLGLNLHYFRNDADLVNGNTHLNDRGARLISEDFSVRMGWLAKKIHRGAGCTDGGNEF